MVRTLVKRGTLINEESYELWYLTKRLKASFSFCRLSINSASVGGLARRVSMPSVNKQSNNDHTQTPELQDQLTHTQYCFTLWPGFKVTRPNSVCFLSFYISLELTTWASTEVQQWVVNKQLFRWRVQLGQTVKSMRKCAASGFLNLGSKMSKKILTTPEFRILKLIEALRKSFEILHRLSFAQWTKTISDKVEKQIPWNFFFFSAHLSVLSGETHLWYFNAFDFKFSQSVCECEWVCPWRSRQNQSHVCHVQWQKCENKTTASHHCQLYVMRHYSAAWWSYEENNQMLTTNTFRAILALWALFLLTIFNLVF